MTPLRHSHTDCVEVHGFVPKLVSSVRQKPYHLHSNKKRKEDFLCLLRWTYSHGTSLFEFPVYCVTSTGTIPFRNFIRGTAPPELGLRLLLVLIKYF